MWNRMIALLACLLVGLSAVPAGAVIIFPTGGGEPIKGFLVRQSREAVTIRQVADDGTVRNRTIPRSQIDDMIVTVSAERLERLHRDRPRDYRDYAEELAEKREDPEARAAAIRLYLIAAYLDPENLGRSSLLGMTGVARSADEQRKFRAMVYLLDPDHDPRTLRKTDEIHVSPGNPGEIGSSEALLKVLQRLRHGRKREALALSERGTVKDEFGRFAHLFSHDQFVDACNAPARCEKCDKGYVPCTQCGGSGRTRDSTVPCSACHGSAKSVCPACSGHYTSVVVAPEVLRKILAVELALAKGTGTPGSPESKTVAESSSWSQIVAQTPSTPVPSLTLETLTEFDPKACHFRNGKWGQAAANGE